MSSIASSDRNISMRGEGLLKILGNNPKRLKRIKFLGQLFATNGFELRVAGGAVRDILTGKEPSDIDLATTARPEQTLEILEKHAHVLRIIVTDAGLKHGTVAVKFKEAELDFKKIKLSHEVEGQINADLEKPEYDEESPFEITTLRCDDLTDGRHAEVRFISDWKVDAERRDLTINAMFLSLDQGLLVDYFNGESDLKHGVVRFVGDPDLRIQEDYLRILRFFRFWSRYGRNQQPDENTLAKIKKNLDGLNQISGERIWQEIKKTFQMPSIPVIDLMLRLEVLKKSGVADVNLDNYNSYVDKVMEEIKLIENNIANSENIELVPIIRFATTIQTLDMFVNAHKRLKFSNIEKDTILYLYENRSRIMTLKDLKYELAMADFHDRKRMLHKQMHALLVYKGMQNDFRELESWQVPEFPLTGGRISEEFRKRKLPKKCNNQIKVLYKLLKNEWASSDYELSIEDLIDRLCLELDTISKNLISGDGKQ